MTDWGDEWNRTIKTMPLAMYMDWVLAKRPGFSPRNNLELQRWAKTWRITKQRVPYVGKVA